jgi:hypothetical protein
VRVLDLGADDYVVEAGASRRTGGAGASLIRRGQEAAVPDLMLGRLRLDTVGKRAWLDDKALDLNAREWAALAFLTSRVNRIVSKEQLMQALYDWQDDISANAIENCCPACAASWKQRGSPSAPCAGWVTTSKNRTMLTRSTTSLRLMLIDRLLPAMLGLLLIGALAANWVALRAATKAYDRGLLDTAFAIAEQLRVVDGKLQLPLSQQTRAVLLTDKFDQVFYAVHGSQGDCSTAT